MTPIRRSLSLLMVAALTAACTAAPGASVNPTGSPAPSASNGQADTSAPPSATPTSTPAGPAAAAGLALIRTVDGIGQVFVIEPDGSARQVSGLDPTASVPAVRPFWSPDHTMIAFRPRTIGSGPDPQLWVVNADGTDQRAVATVGESIGWSPDSTTLLFQDSTLTTDTSGRPARIWLLDVASGEAHVLLEGDNPQWLPDGAHISYVPVRTDVQEDTAPLLVVDLVGGEPRQVAEAQNAWWSPDGTALLLQQPDGLYLAEPDGSDARHLVDGGTAAWSPDGSLIVYQYDHDADALPIIGVVDRDGNVLWSGQVGGDPTWSPDGRMLAVEVGYPTTSIQILDARSGEFVWTLDGEDPAW